MAERLSTLQQCGAYFRHYVVTRLHHWRGHAAVQTIEIATLDREHEHILKAISLGLELDDGWPVVRDLIVAFAPYMERRGHWESWHLILQRAIGTAQKLTDQRAETTLSALLARLSQQLFSSFLTEFPEFTELYFESIVNSVK
jgi:hypothetical protein